MATICGKCGEPLLGSVNRCWRCGALYQASSDSEVPPVCRGPVLPNYLHHGKELSADEFSPIIVAEEVTPEISATDFGDSNNPQAENNEIEQRSAIEDKSVTSAARSLEQIKDPDPLFDDEDQAQPSFWQKFAGIFAYYEKKPEGIINSFVIVFSVLAITLSYWTIFSIPFSVVALGVVIWQLNYRRDLLLWFLLFFSIFAFACTSLRLSFYLYFLMFRVAPFTNTTIFVY